MRPVKLRQCTGLLAFAALLVSPPAHSGVAARQASPRNASYTLTATLDAVNSNIFGTGRLTWRNISRAPATELRFHMYWNAFRDPSSTWLREQFLGRTPALASWPSEDLGFIDLTSLSLVSPAGNESLLAQAKYIAPDDGNASDRTVLSVPLAKPVAPGETIALDLGWNAHVPRTFARTGVLGNFFFIAHWFPKIGVLEDTGWNAHQFHAATEFFSDYGEYDVRLTVPKGWTVGATGREQSKTDNDTGTTTHRYVEQDVHDFAWTTSPDYLDQRQRFEEPGLPAVDLRLLLQPEHSTQADRHFAAARAALKYYGQWFGPYPYGQLTIVDPATVFNTAQGNGADGMEYPTLITAGTRWVAPWKGNEPESVTVHEAGHEFFYGLVATNEFEHAWMDEGINTYVTARVMATAFPDRFFTVERYFGGFVPWPYADVPWSRDVHGNRIANYRLAPAWDALSTPTWRGYPGTVRSITYAKTALALASLERILGWDAMQRVLSTHFARGKFRHPTPDEFFATASETAGQDLTWFFDAVYRRATTFDYAIGDVTRRVADNGSIDTTIVVRRLGDGVFPIDVLTTFDDGSSVTERWDGADRWHAFRYRRGANVERVVIDPDRILTLDLSYTNNSWSRHPAGPAAAEKWAARWLTWLENVLLTYAFFA